MNIRMFFHLFPDEAKAMEMTHHGTIFWIPAYFAGDPRETEDYVRAVAVMPLLTLLFYPLGWLFDLYSTIVPYEVMVPLTVDYKL
jgi:hypothetical protein